jgi:hypothetical protein
MKKNMTEQTVTLPRMNVELMLDWLDGHYLKRPEFEEIRRLLAAQADSKKTDDQTQSAK